MLATVESVPADLVPLEKLGNLYPVRAHRATVFRHIATGIKRPHGVVKLRTIFVGGRRYGCREWVDEFIAELNRAEAPSPHVVQSRRQRAAASAMAALQTR